MEDLDIRLDLNVDDASEEPERRSCLTCAHCSDLCPGCWCLWKVVGAKCTTMAVSYPRAMNNIRVSRTGAEVDCPAWEGRG